MAATVNVNGKITDDRKAVVSVFDHGFLYGEGIYETMRTYNGRPFLYDRHMRRMRKSAQMMSLKVPFTDEELAGQISATIAASKIKGEVYVRVLVTRGVGDLTYDIEATPTPSTVIIVKPQVDPSPQVYADGVRVVIVDVIRNHPHSVSPIIKSNNLMNCALGMQQAIARGGFEGVMRNYRGELSECTTANLFIVKEGVALTPPIEAGLLPGITREFLFDVGKDVGVEVRQNVMWDEDLYEADEAFLTSTTREAVPIVRVDDRTIGTGKPGPVTRKLLEGFRKVAHAKR